MYLLDISSKMRCYIAWVNCFGVLVESENWKRQFWLTSLYILCSKCVCCSHNIARKNGRWRWRLIIRGLASSIQGAPESRWNVPGGRSLKVWGGGEGGARQLAGCSALLGLSQGRLWNQLPAAALTNAQPVVKVQLEQVAAVSQTCTANPNLSTSSSPEIKPIQTKPTGKLCKIVGTISQDIILRWFQHQFGIAWR